MTETKFINIDKVDWVYLKTLSLKHRIPMTDIIHSIILFYRRQKEKMEEDREEL